MSQALHWGGGSRVGEAALSFNCLAPPLIILRSLVCRPWEGSRCRPKTSSWNSKRSYGYFPMSRELT